MQLQLTLSLSFCDVLVKFYAYLSLRFRQKQDLFGCSDSIINPSIQSPDMDGFEGIPAHTGIPPNQGTAFCYAVGSLDSLVQIPQSNLDTNICEKQTWEEHQRVTV